MFLFLSFLPSLGDYSGQRKRETTRADDSTNESFHFFRINLTMDVDTVDAAGPPLKIGIKVLI